MTLFKGSGVALVTPFKHNTEKDIVVDYDALEKLIEYQISNKTDSIIICGTTGESPTLTEKEHSECIKRCVDIVDGRVPVIAGTGSNSTQTAIELSKQAEHDGADGLLCVTPYYNKTNQEGLKLYYKRIADAVDIPIIMYNVPSRTGVNILPQTAIDIAEQNENVVAIKEASGNIDQVKAITKTGKLEVYSGNDDQIFDVMEWGGIGVISVLANIFPEETHDMIQEAIYGDMDLVYYKQQEVLPLVKALFSDVNPIPIKKAVELENLCSGLLREPLIELDEEKTKVLKKEISAYKKIINKK